MPKNYREERDRNGLTHARVRSNGTLNPIALGTIAELGDHLDRDQCEFLIGMLSPTHRTVAAAAATCVLDSYAMHKMPFEVKVWLKVEARKHGMTTGEYMAALVVREWQES